MSLILHIESCPSEIPSVADPGTNHRPVQLWPISIHIWQLQWRGRLFVPFPCALHR